MGKFIDLTGQRFGRRVVIAEAGRTKGNQVKWLCLCDCGTVRAVAGTNLRNGKSLSCGCVHRGTVRRKAKDYTGQVFWGCTGLKSSGRKNSSGRYLWLFSCVCEKVFEINPWDLEHGECRSCGCYGAKQRLKATITHGLSKTNEYRRAKCSKRRALKLQATPPWFFLQEEAIQEFYHKCPEGSEVDHKDPLKGELICGLHVLDNLQYLPKSENRRKKNKFTPYIEVKATGERTYLDN